MNIKRKASLFTLALILVLSIIFAVPASAEIDPWRYDAQIYAKQQGVTVQEAMWRFDMQRIAGPLDADLRSYEEDTFAGLWLEHSPQFKLIVQFTRNGEETIKNYLPQELVGVTEVRTASYSVRELKQVQTIMINSVEKSEIPTSIDIDVKKNKVQVNVIERDRLDNCISDGLINVPNSVEINTVSSLPEFATDCYGGGSLKLTSLPYYDNRTAGFPVITSGGTKGIVTCQHGDPVGNLRWGGYFGTNLTYQSGVLGYSYDTRWYTCSGLTVLPKIQYSTDGSLRTIYSTVGRDSQGVGWFVSKYGLTTGYTAGYISSKDVTITGIPNCSATFIKVDNTAGYDVLADFGDSGGPWFFGSDAYGTTVAKDDTGDAYYMAVNYIYEALGVNIYTG